MKTQATTRPINLKRVVLGTALILTIPLVAMQFSDEVQWTGSDFLVMGLLLFCVGMLYEYIASTVRDKNRRLLLIAALLLGFLYLWAELTVGVFTNWGS